MSNLSLWSARSPFGEFDELVRRAFGTGSTPAWPASGFRPAAEVSRDGDDAVIRVEAPGLDVEQDVRVEVDRGRLVVRGERRDERSEPGRVREVRYGRFERSWTLPEHVGADAVSAHYEAGVLNVRVTGVYADAPEPGAHRIPVTAGAPAEPTVTAGVGAEPDVPSEPEVNGS
jgi:HSP20 family molecular chaperone IbpA